MTEIVEGLDGATRDQVAELLESGHFFWLDVALSDTSPDDLREVLGIPEETLHALLGFGTDHPSSRKFHADGKRVAFALSAYLESTVPADDAAERLPANAPHVFRNVSEWPARLLCLCSPAGQEEFFKEIGVPVTQRTEAPPELDDAAARAFMARRP